MISALTTVTPSLAKNKSTWRPKKRRPRQKQKKRNLLYPVGGKQFYRVRVPVVVNKRYALINISRLFKPEFFALQYAFAILGQRGKRSGGFFAFLECNIRS
ncbi:MAG: hypothetical protein IJG38_09940 [Thermoguttaceae bacterium]|nr:hypothetical protein [Thermoguttaceae bacterium]